MGSIIDKIMERRADIIDRLEEQKSGIPSVERDQHIEELEDELHFFDFGWHRKKEKIHNPQNVLHPGITDEFI